MSPVTFNTFLIVSTAVIVALAIATWIRTRNPAYPIGFGLIYYWTLYGAWFILIDTFGGDTGMRYRAIDELSFAVEPDEYYLKTLFLYSLFIIVLQATVLLRSPRPSSLPACQPLKIDHARLTAIGLASLVITISIILPEMKGAIRSGSSAYSYISSRGLDGWYTLHQFLNRVALLAPGLGIVILASGKRGRFVVGRKSQRAYITHAFALAVMTLLCVILGNKNELLFALLTCVIFYIFNAERPRLVRLTLLGATFFALIGAIDYVRHHPTDRILGYLSISELAAAVGRIGNSNEAFAAHRSLYGVLRYDVPLVYGRSILDLICAFVPRLFWPDRPEGVYTHYRYYTSASLDVSATIHHAAGWYLNFGVIGIGLGASLLGWIWSQLFRLQVRFAHFRNLWFCAFVAITPAAFTGAIPQTIRSGIGGYKGIIILALLTPTSILACSAVRRRRNAFRRHPIARMSCLPFRDSQRMASFARDTCDGHT
jgi:hypothetical protein